MKLLQLTLRVTAIVLALTAGVGHAATYYFTGQSDSSWNNGDNWSTASCSGAIAHAVPTASDDIVICDGNLVEVTDTAAVARTISIGSFTGTRLDIKPSSGSAATLTLGSGGSSLTSTLDWPIRLLDAAGSSNKATLAFVSADHTLAGSSTAVQGSDDLAEITIATGKTLTCQTRIQGSLKIIGDGKFVSQGAVVEAIYAGDTMLVAPYELDDVVATGGGEPSWRVYGAGTLKFGSQISVVTGGSLVGNFFMGGGLTATIVVDEPLTTTGGLSVSTGGKLVVNQNLTMGSQDHPCEIHDGSIEVVADKTFIHY